MLRAVLFITFLVFTHSASAATVTFSTSATGNICSIFDANSENGLNDCNEINQQNGNPIGLFSLSFYNLPSPSPGPVNFNLTSLDADLFGPAGGNSTGEFFALSLNSLSLGTLFDGSQTDEANGPGIGLAASVAANIAAATTAPHALNLSFSLAYADFVPLVSQGSLTAFLDFRQDRNVNRFVDPTFTVQYQVGEIATVPLPSSVLLLLAALVLLAQMKHNVATVGRITMLKQVNPLPGA